MFTFLFERVIVKGEHKPQIAYLEPESESETL